MHVRQALFLSSQRSASLETMTLPGYLLHVEAVDEEYKPLFNIYNSPGPFYLTRYILTVTRQDSEYKATESHYEHKFADIEELEDYLITWQIWIEDNWKPDEPEEKVN